MSAESVKNGAIFGSGMGVLVSVLVGIGVVFGGPEPSERHGVSMSALVFAYILGGTGGGVIAGSLSFLARWWTGTMLVGFLSALPFYLLLHIHDYGLSGWENLDSVIVPSLFIGAPGGLLVRSIIRKVDPFGPLK